MPALSVVIPTLNAARSLPACLDVLYAARAPTSCGLESSGRIGLAEILIADGGSSDGTCRIAKEVGARVVGCERGRGPQLAAAMEEVASDWALVLHADTRLEPGWEEAVADFVAMQSQGGRAACFQLTFDEESPSARRVARLANWRARRLGLPYGDQGLLVHRADYLLSGGYPPDPLMEDVALARRLRRVLGRDWLEVLPVRAVTSADRYRRDGWWRRPAINLTLLALYFLRVSPGRLARFYG